MSVLPTLQLYIMSLNCRANATKRLYDVIKNLIVLRLIRKIRNTKLRLYGNFTFRSIFLLQLSQYGEKIIFSRCILIKLFLEGHFFYKYLSYSKLA